MKTTAVILNFRRADDTIECIRSVHAQDRAVDVIVVDNASGDGSADRIAQAAPEVTLIRSSINAGYAGGNNIGIRRALASTADAILVLNNDLTLEAGCVVALERALEATAGAGIVGPLSLLPGPDDIVDFFTGRVLLDHAALVAPARDEPWHERFTEPRSSEYLTGSAFLAKREAFDRAGLFDERFFLVWEDVDLSLRVRNKGFGLFAVPNAVVRHARSATFGDEASPLQRYFFVRNPYLIIRKHLRPPRRWAAEARATRRYRKWMNGDDPAVNAAIKLGMRHGLRGRFGPPPPELAP